MPQSVWFHTSRCTIALLAAARRGNPNAWKFMFGVAALVLVPLALVLIYAAWKEKKRTQALAQIAAGLRFEFFPAGDSIYVASLAGLEFFNRGRDKKSKNLIRGTSQNLDVTIFDYSYVTGSGRSSRTWKQTVICLQSAALDLPDFIVSTKSFWTMIGSIFGHSDIEIEGHPVFSKLYQIHGSDTESIRKAFSDNVLSFFEEHLGLSSQGANNRLALFRISKRLPPDEIATFLEEGLTLLSLLQAESAG